MKTAQREILAAIPGNVGGYAVYQALRQLGASRAKRAAREAGMPPIGFCARSKAVDVLDALAGLAGR